MNLFLSKKSQTSKAFTLIELLVVISIISLFSSIVLASLNTARSKAKDAAIKGGLSNMRAAAEIQYSDSGDWNTICHAGTQSGDMWREIHSKNFNNLTSPTVNVCASGDVSFIGYPGGSVGGERSLDTEMDSYGGTWAVAVELSNDNWFCIDSSGAAAEFTTRTIGYYGNADRTCG